MTDETVSVICFFCYGKLLFCNVRNAPRGCALRRTRQMSQAIYVSLRPLLNKRHWRENVPRACLKNHFRNLQAPLCGIFYPHSVAVARYAALIRINLPQTETRSSRKTFFRHALVHRFRNEFCLTYRKVLSDKMQYINMQKRQI